MASVRELSIEGAHVFEPQVHRDERGSFQEVFRQSRLRDHVGRPFPVRQVSRAVSRAGVLRGIHVTDVPPGQGKYVTCAAGAVLDVVVDLRVGSPTFGRWEAVRLDETNGWCLYLAEGLGHAYCSLLDGSTLLYLCAEAYAPHRDRDVNALDPGLGIDWPPGPFVMSAKDTAAPTLAEALALGILPSYDDCVALYDGLASAT